MLHARSIDRPALQARSAYGAVNAPSWWTSFALSTAVLVLVWSLIFVAIVVSQTLFAAATGILPLFETRPLFPDCAVVGSPFNFRPVGCVLLAGIVTHLIRCLRYVANPANG